MSKSGEVAVGFAAVNSIDAIFHGKGVFGSVSFTLHVYIDTKETIEGLVWWRFFLRSVVFSGVIFIFAGGEVDGGVVVYVTSLYGGFDGAFHRSVVHVRPCEAGELGDVIVVCRVEAVEADSAFRVFAADAIDIVPGAGVVYVSLYPAADFLARLAGGVAGVVVNIGEGFEERVAAGVGVFGAHLVRVLSGVILSRTYVRP